MQFDISQEEVHQLSYTKQWDVEFCPINWFISYLLNGFESIQTHALAKSFSLVVSFC